MMEDVAFVKSSYRESQPRKEMLEMKRVAVASASHNTAAIWNENIGGAERGRSRRQFHSLPLPRLPVHAKCALHVLLFSADPRTGSVSRNECPDQSSVLQQRSQLSNQRPFSKSSLSSPDLLTILHSKWSGQWIKCVTFSPYDHVVSSGKRPNQSRPTKEAPRFLEIIHITPTKIILSCPRNQNRCDAYLHSSCGITTTNYEFLP